jgi:hypothetical protein
MGNTFTLGDPTEESPKWRGHSATISNPMTRRTIAVAAKSLHAAVPAHELQLGV